MDRYMKAEYFGEHLTRQDEFKAAVNDGRIRTKTSYNMDDVDLVFSLKAIKSVPVEEKYTFDQLVDRFLEGYYDLDNTDMDGSFTTDKTFLINSFKKYAEEHGVTRIVKKITTRFDEMFSKVGKNYTGIRSKRESEQIRIRDETDDNLIKQFIDQHLVAGSEYSTKQSFLLQAFENFLPVTGDFLLPGRMTKIIYKAVSAFKKVFERDYENYLGVAIKYDLDLDLEYDEFINKFIQKQLAPGNDYFIDQQYLLRLFKDFFTENDPDLKAPGIYNGKRRYSKRNYDEREAIKKFNKLFTSRGDGYVGVKSKFHQEHNDIFGSFINELVEKGDDYSVVKVDLLRAFKEYTTGHGIRFVRTVEKRFDKLFTLDGKRYIGIKLVEV